VHLVSGANTPDVDPPKCRKRDHVHKQTGPQRTDKAPLGFRAARLEVRGGLLMGIGTECQ